MSVNTLRFTFFQSPPKAFPAFIPALRYFKKIVFFFLFCFVQCPPATSFRSLGVATTRVHWSHFAPQNVYVYFYLLIQQCNAGLLMFPETVINVHRLLRVASFSSRKPQWIVSGPLTVLYSKKLSSSIKCNVYNTRTIPIIISRTATRYRPVKPS